MGGQLRMGVRIVMGVSVAGFNQPYLFRDGEQGCRLGLL